MGKFFYKHFGDDVPLYIEREYNRLLIQEHNQEIKEQKNRVQTLNFDEVTEFFPDPSTIPVSEHELEKHRLDADRLEYLPIALKLLEIEHPDLYVLVTEYFLSADRVTFTALARTHNISVDRIRYKIGLAKKRLKEYYDMHENKG